MTRNKIDVGQTICDLYLFLDIADDICRDMYDLWEEKFILGEDLEYEDGDGEYNLDDIQYYIDEAISYLKTAKRTIKVLNRKKITTARQISNLYPNGETNNGRR